MNGHQGWIIKKLLVVAAIVGVGIATLAIAAPALTAKTEASTGGLASRLTWLIGWNTADAIASNSTAVADLKGATIYEIVAVGGKIAPGLPAITTLDFKSVAQMKTDFEAGDIKPWDKAVVYDPEHWSYTPLSEQLNVVAATAEAEQLATEYHLMLIATPGTDLMTVLTPGQWPLYQDYLSYNLAGKVAESKMPMFAVQAQFLERDLSLYLDQTTKGAAQVHTSSPDTIVLGDATQSIEGTMISTSTVVKAIRAASPYVSGYFFNAPTRGGQIIQALG